MSFTSVTALLCTLSWISVSVSGFHTEEVQPGDEVTLLCTNFTRYTTHIYWFRVNNKPNASCIASMFSSDEDVSFCDGFENGKFNMSSNITTLFLKIEQVDLSDSGLYFCGSYSSGKPELTGHAVSATYLKVQEKSDVLINESVILAGLIIFLIIVVIGLAIKIRKLQTAHEDGQNPRHSEGLGSGDLNYAVVSSYSKPKTKRRPASEREMETNVLYAATR